MIRFPVSMTEAAALHASGHELRAGGTDLGERRKSGVSVAPLADLMRVPGLDRLRSEALGLTIGSGVVLADLEQDPRLRLGYRGLHEAIAGLATPQVRNRATVGGSLMQRVRCWYFRHPDLSCLKQGGSSCLARAGDHLFHACFDQGPCIAPHPSTVGMALLCWDALVELSDGARIPIDALFGQGSDPTRENTLQPGQVLTALHLPAPAVGDQSAWVRAIHRARAEWPLVEATARLRVEAGVIVDARVAVGGVANVPLRLAEVEAALAGRAASADTIAAAAALAGQGRAVVDGVGWKLPLVGATVEDALARALTAPLFSPTDLAVWEATR